MSTPKIPTRGNSALWVIALLLAVIATCLVVLVSRQQRQLKAEIVEMPASAPAPEATAPPSRPLRIRSASERARDNSPALQTVPAIVEAPSAPQAAVGPVATNEPIVSGGLAPLTSLAATNAITNGVITGRVILKGTPPAEHPIPFDAQCGTLHPPTATTQWYLVSADGGLSNVFVFIKSGLEGKRFPTPSQPVLLNQKGCFFEPYVFGLMVNQKLQVKNSDPMIHNVHYDGTESGNSAFNIAEGPGGTITRSFRSPELPLTLRCDVHPWMIAYACVVANPFFAVTDAEGNYSISNVPPGNYVLEAYHVKTHRRHGGETEPIAVTAGETTTANFTIKLPTTTGSIVERR